MSASTANTTAPEPTAAHTAAPAPTADGPRVAVLGTGAMGAGMVRSLLRAGLPAEVWNRDPRRAAPLASQGATVHTSPAEAAAAADVVITMLADAAATRSVALDAGMLAAMRPGAVWAQMGTIGVAGTEELAGLVATRRPDVDFVDAPVSGTRGPAEAGELLILASGPERARPPLAPVFGALGQATRWLGDAGEGSRFKLVTNAWMIFLVEGAAEVMALADALGVDRAAVLELFSAGRMSCAFVAGKARKMDSGDDSPDFSLQWAAKDAGLALDAAPGRALTGLEAVRDRWRGLVDAGLGELDTSAARHGFGESSPAPR
ncbi:MAG TPA: NAD(P)-dependent oxidoreductase [Streptosporangiaceae bacterium]|nr:NAD(P)-dependent oxidoreductase [Streptosporangiaceae bacterium]